MFKNNENKKKNLIKMKKLNMKKTNKCFCLILLFLSIYFIEWNENNKLV